MKTTLTILWLFVFLVLAYDVYFAIIYQDSILHWESNAVAVAIIKYTGIYCAIFLRCFSVLFALVVICLAPPRTQWIGTIAAFLIHVYLGLTYLAIWNLP